MSEELTLLPCYKCGGTAMYHHYDKYPKGLEPVIIDGETVIEGHVWHFVNCEKCREQRAGLYPINSKEAITEWNSIPRSLAWTNEPPKVPGYYWLRYKSTGKTAWSPTHIIPILGALNNYSVPEEWTDVEWAGPIPEPRECHE